MTACSNSETPPVAVHGDGPYSLTLARNTTTLTFPSYDVIVRHGKPFGIVSLNMGDQPGDFAHWDFPLADWEWFWYDEDGSMNDDKRTKLLETAWSEPEIEQSADSVQLLFKKTNVLLPGLNLEVNYSFEIDGTFSASYTIENKTGSVLPKPYSMIGFPGFSNHRWVSAVATSVEPRFSKEPFVNFWEEADADGREEYTLLRQEFDDTIAQQLKGLVAISAFDSWYVLQATFLSTDQIAKVSSAHVNKPGYLTSHLYVFLKDLPDGNSQTLRVFYRLSRN